MKRLIAIFFTIMLVFAPIASAVPVLTEEALIIPIEDLELYVELFVLIAQYDDLIIGALGNIHILTENFRVKINTKMIDNKVDRETINIITSYLVEYNKVNNAAHYMYTFLLNKYGIFSEETYDVLGKVLKRLGK